MGALDLEGRAGEAAVCAVEAEGVEGVICGRSIYEGTLDLRSAQERADVLSDDRDAD